jgi:uncharacterized protein YacL
LASAIRGILQLVFALFGAFFGWSIAQSTAEFYVILDPPMQILNKVAFVGLGILVGVGVAPTVARTLVNIIASVTVSLEKLTLQEILLGAVGLIFGLIIAFFSSLLMSSLPIGRIPIVGEYLAPLVLILVTMFWAVLGAFFGTRMAVVHSLSQLFASGNTPAMGGARGFKLLDTSVVVDGRIADVCKAGFLEGTLIVPIFVLEELQAIADSADPLKRGRGRRGLNVLHMLRKDLGIEIYDKPVPDAQGVDSKLVKLAQERKGDLVTTDYNLNRVASLQGVRVLNLNELANAVKAVVLPGEELTVHLIRPGKESGQAVGYLEDGTMIVCEEAHRQIGNTVPVEVTSVLQTVAGKMIFARLKPKVQ